MGIFKKAENVPIEDYLKHLDEDVKLRKEVARMKTIIRERELQK